MLESKLITKKDLELIADIAKDNFLSLAKKDMTDSQFIAKCYLEASAYVLKLGKREYEERIPYAPPEE